MKPKVAWVNGPLAQHLQLRTQRNQRVARHGAEGGPGRVIGSQKADLAVKGNLSQDLGGDRHPDIFPPTPPVVPLQLEVGFLLAAIGWEADGFVIAEAMST